MVVLAIETATRAGSVAVADETGVLIIFDRWFGTYVEEDEPVDYGIPRQIRSNNLWTLNTHEFVDIDNPV